MFTPKVAEDRALNKARDSVAVKTTLREIELEFSKGRNFISGKWQAALTWESNKYLNEYERRIVVQTLTDWGWKNVKFSSSYQSDNWMIVAEG